MAIFAVTYAYDQNSGLRDELRPSHRGFLSGLHAAGALLASGPVESDGSAGALIIVRADSAEGALALLGSDPFLEAGTIAERQAVAWNPVIGPWLD